jgi:4-diphosphocytidyl-2-C-methyl-D-erythritol kinase
VLKLRETFQQIGTLGTMMSGSGPTVFALTESQSQAEEIKEKMRATIQDPDLDLWVTRFRQSGIQLVE